MSATDEHADVVIVGGGISGLTTAYRLLAARPHLQVVVLERGASGGGTARTDHVDGFVVDRGPNGFLTNVDSALALAIELGLDDELQPATDDAKERYLFFGGRLQKLPTSPFAFVGSGLLPLGAKLRVAWEPFAKGPPDDEDESVWDFAARRLGPRFADTFMGPMVTGIVAGDAKQTSLASLFPRMRRLEAEHGSLIRAMRSVAKQRRAQGAESGGPAGPGGRLTSFRDGGIGVLTRALADRLGDRLQCGVSVQSVTRDAESWRVETDAGATYCAPQVVVATPSWVASELLAPASTELSDALAAIPYAGVRMVALGWPRDAMPDDFGGFGFLVPRGEALRILGCLYSSNVFPDQAPDGQVLMRIIAGGVHDPEILAMSDDDALDAVLADLRTALGVDVAPTLVHHVRWDRAIPQYLLGHADRLRRIDDAAAALPGLWLTGNAYRGVALNDCVADASRVAEALASG